MPATTPADTSWPQVRSPCCKYCEHAVFAAIIVLTPSYATWHVPGRLSSQIQRSSACRSPIAEQNGTRPAAPHGLCPCGTTHGCPKIACYSEARQPPVGQQRRQCCCQQGEWSSSGADLGLAGPSNGHCWVEISIKTLSTWWIAGVGHWQGQLGQGVMQPPCIRNRGGSLRCCGLHAQLLQSWRPFHSLRSCNCPIIRVGPGSWGSLVATPHWPSCASWGHPDGNPAVSRGLPNTLQRATAGCADSQCTVLCTCGGC